MCWKKATEYFFSLLRPTWPCSRFFLYTLKHRVTLPLPNPTSDSQQHFRTGLNRRAHSSCQTHMAPFSHHWRVARETQDNESWKGAEANTSCYYTWVTSGYVTAGETCLSTASICHLWYSLLTNCHVTSTFFPHLVDKLQWKYRNHKENVCFFNSCSFLQGFKSTSLHGKETLRSAYLFLHHQHSSV